MEAIGRYFWFGAGALMIGYVLFVRARGVPLVAQGVLEEREASQLTRGTIALIAAIALAQGSISLVAGWTLPTCAGIFSFEGRYQTAAAFVNIGVYAFVLWWIWLANGGSIIARVIPALPSFRLGGRRFAPRTCQFVATFLILGTCTFSAVMWRVQPPPRTVSCGVQSAAG